MHPLFKCTDIEGQEHAIPVDRIVEFCKPDLQGIMGGMGCYVHIGVGIIRSKDSYAECTKQYETLGLKQ